MENLAKAIVEQRRLREAPLPTKEEIIQQAVTELRAILPPKPQLASKKAEESDEQKNKRDYLLKSVLAKTDKQHPETDREFINHIPEIHLSWSALAMLCSNTNLLEVYAKVITSIYSNAHSSEQEHIWLAMDNEELIKFLSLGGMQWSRGAINMIEKQYPTVYKRIFAPARPNTFFD
jgi:hypothetical protein